MNNDPALRHVACGFAHSILCSDSGMCFACGEGTHGELGNERFRVTPRLDMVKSGLDNDGTDACGGKRIVHVACGAHHTLIITSDGFLYTFGDPSRGALGHGPSDHFRAMDGTRRANNIPMLNRWLLGFEYNAQTKFDVRVQRRMPIAVTHASAGDGFSVIVDQHGRVWAWGSNLYGNLGVGDTLTRSQPSRVESLHGIKEVHAGAEHVLAISLQGSCYTWGHGVGGRLGRGDDYDSAVPAIVGHLNSVFVATGNAGDAHSAVVSDGGMLFTWGTGAFGRLGLGDERDRNVPEQVAMGAETVFDVYGASSGGGGSSGNDGQGGEGGAQSGKDGGAGSKSGIGRSDGGVPTKHDAVISVSCGTTNTLAVMASGVLYAFGGGLFGKLGLGDELNQLRPHVVATGALAENNERVVEAACGAFHSMCITKSGTVYGWGFGGALNSRVGLGKERTGDPASEPASHSRYLVPMPVKNFPDRARFLEEQDSNILGFPARHLAFSGCEFDAQKAQMQGRGSGGDGGGGGGTSGGDNSEDANKGDDMSAGVGMDDSQMAALAKLTAVLPPSTIVQIACGRHHTLFLTLGGQLYSSGENECGQLGINSTADAHTPRLVTFPNSILGRERLAFIACGGNHSLSLTARGVAFAWGQVSAALESVCFCCNA